MVSLPWFSLAVYLSHSPTLYAHDHLLVPYANLFNVQCFEHVVSVLHSANVCDSGSLANVRSDWWLVTSYYLWSDGNWLRESGQMVFAFDFHQSKLHRPVSCSSWDTVPNLHSRQEVSVYPPSTLQLAGEAMTGFTCYPSIFNSRFVCNCEKGSSCYCVAMTNSLCLSLVGG